MKAIIRIDVPEYQIGQEVSIYFKDTMMIKGVVQEPKTDVLDKIRAEIVDLGKRTMNDNRASGIWACRDIIDKYKAESEDKE